MSVSKAQKRATQKYNKNHYDLFHIRVPKGIKEKIVVHAKKYDGTLNKFLKRAVDETIEKDNGKDK